MADELPKLAPLPKPEDFAAAPLTKGEVALRAVSVALAQLAGQPETAAQLSRMYVQSDQAKQDTARQAFEQALAGAGEARLRASAQAGAAQDALRTKLAQESGQREQKSLELATARETREAEAAKRSGAREAAALDISKRNLVLNALSSTLDQISKALSGAVSTVNTSALLDPVLTAKAMGQPRDQAIATIADNILRAEEAKKLAAAFPKVDPAAKAKEIAGIIYAGSLAVPADFQQEFVTRLQYAVPTATAANISDHEPLSADQWKELEASFVPSFTDAMVEGRSISLDEMRLFGTALRTQTVLGQVPPAELLKGLSDMVDKSVNTAVAQLGLPEDAQQGLAEQIANQLGELMNGAEDVVGAPFVLRGIGDPDRQVALEQVMQLQTTAAQLRETIRQTGSFQASKHLAEIEREITKLRSKEHLEKTRELRRGRAELSTRPNI